jgi:exosortase/archaeosortase family protein
MRLAAVASSLPWAGRRFALTFAAIATGLFTLYYFPYQENGLSEGWASIHLEQYARLAGGVLSLVEPNVVVSHNEIIGRFRMSIVKSCDAMEANMLFVAAVLALPFAAWRKLAALVVGLAALVALNIVRLCSLYYVGVYLPTQFDRIHVDVWPLFFIGLTALDFHVCLRWLALGATASPAAPRQTEAPAVAPGEAGPR